MSGFGNDKFYIETKDNFGGDLKILNLGYVKGKNELLKNGFTLQSNKMYMRKNNIYFHYNKSLGYWIFEKIIEKKEDIFSHDEKRILGNRR